MARAHFADVAIDSLGNRIKDAQITVYLRGTSTLADIYAAESAVSRLNNPYTSLDGIVSHWADAGAYTVVITDPSGTTSERSIGWSAVPGVEGGIPGSLITDDGITNAKLAPSAVTEQKIASAAVTNAKIADLDAAKLTGSIAAARIPDGSILNAKLGSGIDAAKLTTGALPMDRIATGAITAPKIGDNQITSTKYADGSISARRFERWQGWTHVAETWMGRGGDTGANTRQRITTADFTMPAGCASVTVAVFCVVQDVRGGYVYGQVIAGIEGVGEREMSVDMGNTIGSFWTMYHPQNLTPGQWYRSFCDFRVGNEPLTMSARGGTVNVWVRGA